MPLPSPWPSRTLILHSHGTPMRIQLKPPDLNPLTQPASRLLTSQSSFARAPSPDQPPTSLLPSLISSANFLSRPLPRSGGPFSFPPRVSPLGTANGSAPAHWDPHPNCSRAPQGVAVGGSRAPTHAHFARAPGRREGMERKKGEKGEGRRQRKEGAAGRSQSLPPAPRTLPIVTRKQEVS